MIVEKFRGGNPRPVYARFRARGRLAPDGLTYVGSWVTTDLACCYQVMACEDRSRLDQWIAAWSDLVEFEAIPVLTSAAAVAAVLGNGRDELRQTVYGGMTSVVIGEADPEIVSLEEELRRAQLDADVGALDRLIGDELLFTGPDGRLGTKAEDLAAHASGAVRFRAHEPEELRVRAVGDAVRVAALRARLTVEVAGSPVSGTYRYTRVWAREGSGSWRVVAGHVSVAPGG